MDRTMELPLEAEFRLRTIKSEIDGIADLGKAKELLYKCFEYQLSYEAVVRELIRSLAKGEIRSTNQPPDPKDYQDG